MFGAKTKILYMIDTLNFELPPFSNDIEQV